MFRALSLLPLPILYAVFGVVALGLRLAGWRRGLMLAALGRCLPDLPAAERQRLVRLSYSYLGELAAEVLHAPRMSRGEVAAGLRFENPEVVQQALGGGRRVLLLAAHHCNWEWLLLACSTAFEKPLHAAYKPASWPPADRALKSMRSHFGATMVPAKTLITHMLEQRGKVKLLALLADQSPPAVSEHQAWLPFFGQETAFFTGPGWIGARMGFEPLFIAMRREGRGRYVARLVPLVAPGTRADAAQIIAAYVNALEAQVRAHPAQYFWAYNRWKRARGLYE